MVYGMAAKLSLPSNPTIPARRARSPWVAFSLVTSPSGLDALERELREQTPALARALDRLDERNVGRLSIAWPELTDRQRLQLLRVLRESGLLVFASMREVSRRPRSSRTTRPR